MTYHIIKVRSGYHIAELGLDQFLHLLHSRPMDNAEAAARLRDDLANDRCPFPMTTPSGSHDPGEHAARCYDVAARIVPLLPEGNDAWPLALKIAAAQPWHTGPVYGADLDSDRIPF